MASLRLLTPDAGERMAGRMFAEGLRRLPPGQGMLDVDTFIDVARAFGWAGSWLGAARADCSDS